MDEIWKDIAGFEGLYQASNMGRVKSLSRVVNSCMGHPSTRRERIMKPYKQNSGYNLVLLCVDYEKSSCLVHRLIAKTFIPNPENKKEVNHIDGDKSNNHVTNLEWCTASENKKHAYRIGVMVSSNIGMVREKNFSKRKIFQYDIDLNYIKTFESIRQAEKESGASSSGIVNCANGKRKTSMGFIWRYEQI